MNPEPNIKRCAVYTRRSSAQDLDVQRYTSLDAQDELCKRYIEAHASDGWVYTKTYSDAGISGATTDRPSLQAMLADIEAGLLDVVIVYKLDRLSRSLCDFNQMMRAFAAKGVSFVSTSQAFDTSTPMGRFAMNMLSSFAELERDMTVERIRSKIRTTREKGLWGSGCPPLGYDLVKGELVVNAEHAALVQRVFKLYVGGLTSKEICDRLNESGNLYPVRYGTKGKETSARVSKWDNQKISRVLNNRLYTGVMTYGEEVYPGQHQGIVPQELWDACQARLAESLSRTRSSDYGTHKMVYPLRGLLYCGRCGRKMLATYTSKGGRFFRYYYCGEAKRGKCTGVSIPAEGLEKLVASRMSYLAENEDFLRLLAELLPHISTRTAGDALFNFEMLLKEFTPEDLAEVLPLVFEKVTLTAEGELELVRRDFAAAEETKGGAM